MQPPHGPHTVSRNGQVVIPKAVLSRANLLPGDSVYLSAIDDGTILIVPADVAADWFRQGWAADTDE
jgi:AbrB family looped-hinge helix DNA binding protein